MNEYERMIKRLVLLPSMEDLLRLRQRLEQEIAEALAVPDHLLGHDRELEKEMARWQWAKFGYWRPVYYTKVSMKGVDPVLEAAGFSYVGLSMDSDGNTCRFWRFDHGRE